MSNSFRTRELLLGERQRSRTIDALAGHALHLEARDYCTPLPPKDAVSWEVDGTISPGPKLVWTPDRPGHFALLLRCGSRTVRLPVSVGLRPSDLISRCDQLDYYFCLIAAQPGRIIAHPIAKGRGRSGGRSKKSPSAARTYLEAIANSVDAQATVYRKNFGVFRDIAPAQWPSGLYAVFLGALVDVGTNSLVAKALEQLQRLADLPVGAPIPREGFAAAVAKLDLSASGFATKTIFPETGLGASPASATSGLLDALTAIAGQYGLDIGSTLTDRGGLSALLDINSRNSTIRTRLFGSGGITSQIESALGGFAPDTGNIFYFSPGGGTRQFSPKQSSGGIDAKSGWEKATGESGGGWVPYTGNPRDNGEQSGIFRHKESDGVTTTLYNGKKTDGGTTDGGTTDGGTTDGGTTDGGTTDGGTTDGGTTDGGTTDGGTTDGGTSGEEEIFQLDADLQGRPGPTDDSGIRTAEEIKLVIITTAGGLYEYTTPDIDDTTIPTRTPVIPGAGLKDPVPPFFFEWKPTMDEAKIRPRGYNPLVVDPSPDADESGGSTFGSFPSTGTPRSGILGATPSFSKTSTMIGGVIVESYSGLDDQGRRGDGVFGAVAVDLF